MEQYLEKNCFLIIVIIRVDSQKFFRRLSVENSDSLIWADFVMRFIDLV
jgi:hypothetical protein